MSQSDRAKSLLRDMESFADFWKTVEPGFSEGPWGNYWRVHYNYSGIYPEWDEDDEQAQYESNFEDWADLMDDYDWMDPGEP